MDTRPHATLTDEALERDLARALAVEPSPEFLARVRTRIASEPAPRAWKVSWLIGAVGAVAAAVIVAAIANRADPITAPTATAPLAARAAVGAGALPYGASGFSRTSVSPPEGGRQARGPAEAGPHTETLLDPRETAALRSLIAGVRNNRVNLASLLQPSAPAPMELPPVDDLVIAPLAIEPLAPQLGAPGERQ